MNSLVKINANTIDLNCYVDSGSDLPKHITHSSKPEKHHIYPKYDVFDKTPTEGIDTTLFINNLFDGLIVDAIIAQENGKPVELLTDDEQLGVYIGAGIPMKYEDGKIITIYDVGISLIENKYKVFYTKPKINNTYS